MFPLWSKSKYLDFSILYGFTLINPHDRNWAYTHKKHIHTRNLHTKYPKSTINKVKWNETLCQRRIIPIPNQKLLSKPNFFAADFLTQTNASQQIWFEDIFNTHFSISNFLFSNTATTTLVLLLIKAPLLPVLRLLLMLLSVGCSLDILPSPSKNMNGVLMRKTCSKFP